MIKKNRTKKIAILITPIIIIFINTSFLMMIVAIQNESKDEDTGYECKITEDSELTWKYTIIDPILIQNLSDIYNIELNGLYDPDVKQGSIIKYKINSVEDTKDKWRLEISCESNKISGEDTQELKIYKDPNDVPDSWIYNIEAQSLRILPSETQDYLDEIKDNFSPTENIDIERDSDYSLIICHHINYSFAFTVFQYNDDGILEKFTIIFIDSIALEYILDDYYLSPEIEKNYDSLNIFIAIAITSTILIMILLFGFVLSRNNRVNKNISCQKSSELKSLSNSNNSHPITNKSELKRNHQEYNAINRNYVVNHQKNEEIKNNHIPLKRKYLFCELCGTKIDEDAIYCHYCGNKLYDSK